MRLYEREARTADAERVVTDVLDQLDKAPGPASWGAWAGPFGRGLLLEQLAEAIAILAKLHQDATAEVAAADAAMARRARVIDKRHDEWKSADRP